MAEHSAVNRRVVGFAVAGVIYWRTHLETAPAQVAQSTPAAVTIDLSQAGTTRGSDASTTAPVGVLPRGVVTAHVILPNFSPGGNYSVSITADRSDAAGKAADVLLPLPRGCMPTSRLLWICADCRRVLTSSLQPMRETLLRISIH